MITFCFALGCKSSDDKVLTTPLPSLEPVDPDVPVPGVIDEVGGFNIKLKLPEGTNHYIHQEGDFEKKCVVAKTATAIGDRDIICTVEVEELEGAFHGIEFVLNAPSDMCNYVSYTPYYYFGREYGLGPTAGTIRYSPNGDYVDSTVTGNGYFDSNGAFRCDYDYQQSSGPNCCYGTYNLTVVRNLGSVDPDRPQTTTNSVGIGWGGLPGNCVAGAGKTAPRFSPNGMPMSTLYYSADGFNTSFKVDSSLTKGNSLFYANYYTGATPTAFMSASTYTGRRYYEWRCTSDADEILARIRVQVREWNEINQFVLKSLGDPDTGGNEPDWGDPYNDFADWLDIFTSGDAFPGMD